MKKAQAKKNLFTDLKADTYLPANAGRFFSLALPNYYE